MIEYSLVCNITISPIQWQISAHVDLSYWVNDKVTIQINLIICCTSRFNWENKTLKNLVFMSMSGFQLLQVAFTFCLQFSIVMCIISSSEYMLCINKYQWILAKHTVMHMTVVLNGLQYFIIMVMYSLFPKQMCLTLFLVTLLQYCFRIYTSTK